MKDNYTSVCDKCGRRTWYDQEQQCHAEYSKTEICDTCGYTETIEPIKMVRCTGILRLIVNSELDTRLTSYYESGERVEVIWKKGYKDYLGYGLRTNGKKGRFYIGCSTGCKPIYLAIQKKNSSGGSAILSSAIESVKGLGSFQS